MDDLEGCAHGIPGIAEMKMHPVTEHLHDLASMPRGDLAHELCERQGDLGRHIVPRLFGEFCVPRQVGERRRLDAARRPLTYPSLLERSLDVPELVLGRERLGVTSICPAQHLLPAVAHPNSDLAKSSLQRLVVPEAAAPERGFDRVVEVVRLELGDAPCAVAPDPHCT